VAASAEEVAENAGELGSPLDLRPVPAVPEDMQLGPVDQRCQRSEVASGMILSSRRWTMSVSVRDVADLRVGSDHGVDPALPGRREEGEYDSWIPARCSRDSAPAQLVGDERAVVGKEIHDAAHVWTEGS